MKKLILIPIFLVLLVVSSCDTGGSSSSTADPQTLINSAKQGTWRISNYNHSGVNEASNFTGYNFTFSVTNVLSASNGTNTYVGTWSVVADDSQTNPTGLKFNITIANPTEFASLSKAWIVASYNGSTIYLTESNSSDVLVFTKN